MNRSKRRHLSEKKKDKVLRGNYHGVKDHDGHWVAQPAVKAIGQIAKTPHPCSCWMCRNDRKSEGRTRQEKKSILDLHEDSR